MGRKLTREPSHTATHRYPSESIVIPSGKPGILFSFKSKTTFLFSKQIIKSEIINRYIIVFHCLKKQTYVEIITIEIKIIGPLDPIHSN